MSFQDIGRRRVKADRPRQPPSPARRPRLSSSRSKSIIDEVAADTSMEESITVEIECQAESVRRTSRPTTEYAKIHEEIMQFQRLVRELEVFEETSGLSPENQWRTRITMRSASEAERDIGQKLSDHCSRNDRDARSKSANAKLKRDYRRAQEAFGRIAQLYERKQQAELSLLTATGDGRMYNQQQAQAEEDFFERAMRERENDVLNLNSKMGHVNRIYKELGRLVDEQQEQIDRVEDNMRNARAYAESGAEQIHRARMGFCGALDQTRSFPSSNFMRDPPPPEEGTTERHEDNFRWTLPLETLREDMIEVKKDLEGLGADIYKSGKNAAKRIVSCNTNESKVSDLHYVVR